MDFAAVHDSAFGTKRTSRRAQSMSAFGGKADIGACLANLATTVPSLINDVISAVDVQRFTGDQPCGIVREKCCGHANVVNADKDLCGSLCLCFVQQRVKFGNTRSRPGRKWPRRNRMH